MEDFVAYLPQYRLSALQEARERARAEPYASAQGVSEAEGILGEVKQRSRAHSVDAYVSNEPVNAGMTEAHAKVRLDVRRDQLRHAQEIETRSAMRSPISRTVSASTNIAVPKPPGHWSHAPRFLALLESIQQAYATLRDIRLTVSEMRKILWHDDDLCRMIENNQPTGLGAGERYPTKEQQLVDDWTNAVTNLLADGDALLPGESYRIYTTNGGSSATVDEVRGGHQGPSRQRGQEAAPPRDRPPGGRGPATCFLSREPSGPHPRSAIAGP